MKEHLRAMYRTKILGIPTNRQKDYLFKGESVEFYSKFSDRVVTKVSLAEDNNILTVSTTYMSKPRSEKAYDISKQKKVRVRTGLRTQIFRAEDPDVLLNS